MTATTAMAVAKPNAEYVGRPASFRPISETSTVVPASTTERPAVAVARRGGLDDVVSPAPRCSTGG